MNTLRKHWYDLGALLSIAVSVCIYINFPHLTNYRILMWLSLVALFLHQWEEYRVPGTFPGMINTVMYHSQMPDRYPLNTNTAFYINVCVGWTFYFFAAFFAERAIWLGIATMMVSVGNITAHTIIFNLRGKTFYNAGLVTALLLFMPSVYFFVSIIYADHLAGKADYWIGIPLGIILNVAGVLKTIHLMADKNSPYIFNDRNLLPKDRKKKQ